MVVVCIAYYTVLSVQICNYAQKQCICSENSKNALDESFYGHFCPCRNAANFCHPGRPNAPGSSTVSSFFSTFISYVWLLKSCYFWRIIFALDCWIWDFCINVFLYKKDLRVKSYYAVEYSRSKDLVLGQQLISLS